MSRFAVCLLLLVVAASAISARKCNRVKGKSSSSSDDSEDSDYKGTLREYFLQVEYIEWDYAPEHRNLLTGEDLTDEELLFVENVNEPDQCRIGSVYKKALYVAYTDDTFTRRVPVPPAHGFLGPIVRALVGDRVSVKLRNAVDFPVTFHVHGLRYTKAAEGALTNDGAEDATGDDDVAPGDTYEYLFRADELSGPDAGSPFSSINWAYHSHITSDHEYAGLVGPIVVADPACADWRTAEPADVHREFFGYVSVMDENLSPLFAENIDEKCDALDEEMRTQYVNGELESTDEADEFGESNLMHAINGLMFGNLNYTAKFGEKTRWYIFSFGTEVDIHTFHWHGVVAIDRDRHHLDVEDVFPATFKVDQITADNRGIWQVHCHVNDHFKAGMTALFSIV